jgi:integrase
MFASIRVRNTYTGIQRAAADGANAKSGPLLADGGNLFLQATAGADGAINRSWVFKYELDGRRHAMGLGALHTIGLAEARARARTLRQQLLDGIDPLDARRRDRDQRRLAAAKALTFAQCAEAYLEAHAAGWRNQNHRAQWRMTLTEYCGPIADLSVQAVDTDSVMRVLVPLWTTRTQTAKRLRGRIERVLAWAKGRGLRNGENPARWSGHLDEMLPAPSRVRAVKHHSALPYAETPAFMAALRDRDSIPARALEFLTLTAARSGEVRGATWSEFDLQEQVWEVPAERMKAGAPHRVPLSSRVIEILKSLPRRDALVFPGTQGRPLGDKPLSAQLQALRAGSTVHGLRATFKTWASEQTNFPHEVSEAALAHKVPDAVVRAYRRTDFFDRRRKLMDQWAGYCSRSPASATVTPLRRPADA